MPLGISSVRWRTVSRVRNRFHNDAKVRPLACPGGVRKTESEIGPGASGTGFLSPPAPRGLERPGPSSRTVQSPVFFGPVHTGPFLFTYVRGKTGRLFQRRHAGAEHITRDFLAARLQDDSDGI